MLKDSKYTLSLDTIVIIYAKVNINHNTPIYLQPKSKNKLVGRSKNLGRCEGSVRTLVLTPRDEF
ncbi:hypothetical protein LNA01_26360 [Companilactobacillus nantensis]|nr:hypothetical protein LNA01_26360 [Companilactobacillus nantensis]